MEYKLIVFDLDDTLYQEVDYVYSAYNAIDKFLSERYSLESGLCFGIVKVYQLTFVKITKKIHSTIKLKANKY